jgi:hypothetical protein
MAYAYAYREYGGKSRHQLPQTESWANIDGVTQFESRN